MKINSDSLLGCTRANFETTSLDSQYLEISFSAPGSRRPPAAPRASSSAEERRGRAHAPSGRWRF